VAGMLRVPRTRGAFSGLLLVLLGAWGGLIAFVGPYFNYAYTPDRAWVFNSGRFWLSVLPGALTVLGGLVVFFSANRAIAVMGAWLAALSGAWFVVGGPVSTLITADGANAAGEPVGSTTAQALAQLGFFTGVGALIVFFSAVALGRFTVVGAKDVALAERDAAEQAQLDAALARESERREAARQQAARDEAAKAEAAKQAAEADAAKEAATPPARTDATPDRTQEVRAATPYPRPEDKPKVTTRATRVPDERPRTTAPTDEQSTDRPRANT